MKEKDSTSLSKLSLVVWIKTCLKLRSQDVFEFSDAFKDIPELVIGVHLSSIYPTGGKQGTILYIHIMHCCKKLRNLGTWVHRTADREHLKASRRPLWGAQVSGFFCDSDIIFILIIRFFSAGQQGLEKYKKKFFVVGSLGKIFIYIDTQFNYSYISLMFFVGFRVDY